MTNKLDALLEQFNSDKGERMRVALEKLNSTLTTIFQDVPQIGLIRLYGWTPGFNDGEPCVHEMSAMVDIFDPDDAEYSFWADDAEGRANRIENDPNLALLSGPNEFQYNPTVWENYKRVPNPEKPADEYHATLVKVWHLMHALQEEFNLVYDTDWQLDIVRDPSQDSGFRITKDHYDCGH